MASYEISKSIDINNEMDFDLDKFRHLGYNARVSMYVQDFRNRRFKNTGGY